MCVLEYGRWQLVDKYKQTNNDEIDNENDDDTNWSKLIAATDQINKCNNK